MHTGQHTDISIKMSHILLKLTGISATTNDIEERRRKFAVVYTIVTLVYGVYVNVADIYHSMDDLDVSILFGNSPFLPLRDTVDDKLCTSSYGIKLNWTDILINSFKQ